MIRLVHALFARGELDAWVARPEPKLYPMARQPHLLAHRPVAVWEDLQPGEMFYDEDGRRTWRRNETSWTVVLGLDGRRE
jgi:hypothetical protein